MSIKHFVTAAVLLVTISLPSFAAEYFVTKQGNDANNGTSKATAFLTIQKGVDALQSGDTLTIGRGEYLESVTRDKLGSMDAQTTIRAEIPGSVLLRGDVALPSSAFKKVDGYRFVYVADIDRKIQAVNETDTLVVIRNTPILDALEYKAGTSHYDSEAKKLYISTSDLQPPSTHHYTVSVLEGNGLLIRHPRRVTIDGISVTGFQNSVPTPREPTKQMVWGILLSGARGCVVRNCVVYLNRSGIGVDSANNSSKDGVENGWNVVEKCIGYGNGVINIIGYASNHDEIRDSIAYRADSYGMRLYGAGIRGPAVLKNNLSWGNGVDLMIKGGKADEFALSANSITLGQLHSAKLKNSIVGTRNQYNSTPGNDNITGVFTPFGNQEYNARKRDQSFADPENFDFRLQSTSPYRGTGPDKTDRGPYPYQPNIFYITATGKDTNDGLSTKKPWKTLAHAMKKLRAGDTLYLESGTYDAAPELKISNAEGQSTWFRGRGKSTVLIRGNLAILESKGLEFERLNFTGAVTLSNSQDIKFNNCRFSSQSTSLVANAVENLKVTHSEFTGFNQPAIQLEKSTQTWLSGNLYDNRAAAAIQTDSANAILYSDYNSYASAENAWHIGGVTLKLAVLPNQQDEYSVVRTPEYSVQNGLPRLQNIGSFDAGGPNGTGIGFYRPNEAITMYATKPEVHSVSDTTANIEWFTSDPAETQVAWGETPDTPNTAVFNKEATTVTDGHNTMSLTGLKPRTKYYFRLLSTRPLDNDTAQYTNAITIKDEPIVFETAVAPSAARVLYVAPNGDNENSGLSRAQAWRTVTHAADAARAGDTVMVSGGTYSEIVRVRASGSEGRPITFKAASGEKVVFSGNKRLLNNAFSIVDKDYINLDGFYFEEFGSGGWKCVVDLRFGKNLQITRCFFNGYGAGSVGTQIRAQACEDVTIRNCVITRGFQGMVTQLAGSILIENNVFLNNLICPIVSSSGPPKSLVAKNNIFVDSIPSKVKVHMFETGGFDRYVYDNNAFYLRVPDSERKAFFFYGSGPGRLNIGEYDQKTGYKNLVVADPQFAISKGQKPKTRTGEEITFLGDWVPRANLDFPDVFVLNPVLTAAGIGLQPESFGDFHFHKKATKTARAAN